VRGTSGARGYRARGSIRVAELTKDDIWTDDAALRAYSYGNLSSYRAGPGHYGVHLDVHRRRCRARAVADMPG